MAMENFAGPAVQATRYEYAYPKAGKLNYSILLMRNKQRKLVSADKMISHFRPMIGSKNAPERLLATPERLFTLHKSANEVASKPLTECRAIKSITIKNINIPIKLYATS